MSWQKLLCLLQRVQRALVMHLRPSAARRRRLSDAFINSSTATRSTLDDPLTFTLVILPVPPFSDRRLSRVLRPSLRPPAQALVTLLGRSNGRVSLIEGTFHLLGSLCICLPHGAST